MVARLVKPLYSPPQIKCPARPSTPSTINCSSYLLVCRVWALCWELVQHGLAQLASRPGNTYFCKCYLFDGFASLPLLLRLSLPFLLEFLISLGSGSFSSFQLITALSIVDWPDQRFTDWSTFYAPHACHQATDHKSPRLQNRINRNDRLLSPFLCINWKEFKLC